MEVVGSEMIRAQLGSAADSPTRQLDELALLYELSQELSSSLGEVEICGRYVVSESATAD